jgi:methylthioribose-1-phosphate isomerase
LHTVEPIRWTADGVVLLDQRRLPSEVIHHTYTDYRELAAAIKDMVIRGAPAIGVTAAMGIALGVQNSKAKSLEELRTEFPIICDTFARTRPTAVDLFWAIERFKLRFQELARETPKDEAAALDRIRKALVGEALKVHEERREGDKSIGRFGAELLPKSGRVMTQCNAGTRHRGHRHCPGSYPYGRRRRLSN